VSVLVTDASGNHALAVVRSLGKKGIRVAAADSTRLAQSFFSRYCVKSATYPSPTRGIGEFREALVRILEKLKPAMLMPMTEQTILALMVNREEIESRVALAPLPSEDTLSVAFDKRATIELARSLNVPTPTTVSFSQLPDLESARSRVSYPAVIKPRRSEMVSVDGRTVSGGAPEYCFEPSEFAAKYLAVHRRTPLPLIQEFIPGEGYGISTLCDRGRLMALFAHRRLRMVRPTGSGSSLRESIVPPTAMVEMTRSLLGALRWHGVAMVEFKLDSRDGVPKLMEINGRFWNSLPLAIASGIDFPSLLYILGTEGKVPECFKYRVGVKSRWLVGDTKHLIGVLRGRPAGWGDGFPSRRATLLDFVTFTGRDLHYDDLWLSDPLPFFAELLDMTCRQVVGGVSQLRAPVVQGVTNA
jgi:predicted ATP-grasp superfamily ATP-dependent carboligase